MLRRPKLGRSSCKGITDYSKAGVTYWTNGRSNPPKPDNLDLVIRWGTTSNVECKRVLNKSEAIHKVADKAGFRKLLSDNGLTGVVISDLPNLLTAVGSWVIRPKYHQQGKKLWVVNNSTTAEERGAIVANAGPGWYAAPLFSKTKEYRVCFVQGRVAWVAEKIPSDPNQVAWNVAQGGTFNNVSWGSWNLRVVRVAREAFLLSGLDFGGVDIMVNKYNNTFVLEMNSAPSLTSPYRQECMAKCFDWIVKSEDKEPIPVVSSLGGWRKFIHPAISSEAWMAEPEMVDEDEEEDEVNDQPFEI